MAPKRQVKYRLLEKRTGKKWVSHGEWEDYKKVWDILDTTVIALGMKILSYTKYCVILEDRIFAIKEVVS